MPPRSSVSPTASRRATAGCSGCDDLPRASRRSLYMTIALSAADGPRSKRMDLTSPVLIAFAGVLCVLIVLPLSWLLYYAFVDRSGAFTLGNFGQVYTDPDFLDPLVTTVIIAVS